MIVGRAGLVAGVGAVSLLLLGPSEDRARAAPLAVALDYSAAAGCPDGERFKVLVTDRLGYDPFEDAAPDHVLVRIAPRNGALDGSLEWRDPKGRWAGEQSFPQVTADCARLVRTVGFALAVQIQLLANSRSAPIPNSGDATVSSGVPGTPPAGTKGAAAPPPAPPPSPAIPAAVEPSPPVVASVGQPPADSGGPRPAFALGAGPSVGFGLSSDPILLARAFGAIGWRRVSFELAATASLPATIRRPDGAGFAQQYLLLGAAACVVFTPLSTCLLASAGEVRLAGENIEHPTSARAAAVSAGARLGFEQSLGHRAFLNAHADGLVALSRWTGRLDQVPVWASPRFAATVGIDAGVRFR